MTKSSSESVKAMIMPVMMPGRISGTSTRKKARAGVQPRSIAASGSARSICCSFGSTCMMTYGRQKVMCAASIDQKPRLVVAPNSRPKNTNMSMSEMPVMMSGFIMGMSVAVSSAVRRYLLRSLFMPTAAAVPITVETIDAITARISVFLSALSVSPSRNSS